jgi:hypothetical protein
VAACAWLVVGYLPDEKPDLIADKLQAARKNFDKSLTTIRSDIQAWIDREETVARRAGNKARLDRLSEEKEFFQATDEPPASVPVRMRDAFTKAREEMEKAYSDAIKRYTASRQDDQAASVQKDYDAFKKKYIADRTRKLLIGAWLDDKPRHWIQVFNENGTMLAKDQLGKVHATGNWSVQKNGVISVKQTNSWTAELSFDGDNSVKVSSQHPTKRPGDYTINRIK